MNSKPLLFADGVLWIINSVLWAAYAHSTAMAVFTGLAALACFYAARLVDA